MLHIPNNTKPINQTKVVVAMSGGVDSSTVAALLHSQGYEVIGITLQLYDLGITLQKKGACCAGQDIYDAKNVADRFGFPHYVLNYESLFKESVIDDFADSYLRGETPIPCVRCNQSVKFRDLLKVAKDLGADALVTGHYVRKEYVNDNPIMLRGVDYNKDQSYFLFATTKEQLAFTYFPLGNMSKQETRDLAKKFGLEVADKPDSQDICFIPNGDYSNVIAKFRPGALDPGNITDTAGNILGKHDGIINFTIGQRRGLGISSKDPLYVIKINPDNKEVVVGPEIELAKSLFKVKNVNWLGKSNFIDQQNLELTVKLRSAHKGAYAKLLPIDHESCMVELFSPERAITPGQACVFYNNDEVLGGGWIVRE